MTPIERVAECQRQYEELAGDESGGALRTRLILLHEAGLAVGEFDPENGVSEGEQRIHDLLMKLIDLHFPEDEDL